LAESSRLVQSGLPYTGIGLVWTKKFGWFYYNAERIVNDVLEKPDQITLQDDPNWTKMPEIGRAMKAQGIEENNYCIAISNDPYCWGLGLSGSPTGRETAAKMALAIRVMVALGRTEELQKKYPELQNAINPQ